MIAAGLLAHYAFLPPTPSYSKRTLLPSFPPPPSAATVHTTTPRAAWVLQHCLGPQESSSERRGFDCGQQIKPTLPGSAQFERQR